MVWQATFIGHGKAGRHLYGSRAGFKKRHRITAGKDATSGNHRNVELLLFHILDDFGNDGGQVVLRPVQTKTEVTTCQRPFHNHKIRQTVQACIFPQKQLQRPHAGHDDAQLGIPKTRVIGNQTK